ncbi:MAG: FrgC protein [Ignavibacteria bacterium]|nr:FrgC protein [Ignavibacteria bacterium]
MKQRILAVDDEPDLIRLLKRIIVEKTNYDIVVTNNPLEIPEILNKEEFDLIITDLKMPGMDGMDILNFIKDNKRNEIVIMITAFGSLDTAMEALSKGVFDYITKPFKKEHLIFTIDKAMKYLKTMKNYKEITFVFDIDSEEESIDAYKKLRAKYRNELLKTV